jgi:hypothetical protein
LEPDLFDWARDRGGPSWIGEILRHARKTGSLTLQDRAAFQRHIANVVTGAIREVKNSHGDVAEHAGSVGKRVAAQLWSEMGVHLNKAEENNEEN